MRRSTIQYIKAAVFIVLAVTGTLLMAWTGMLHSSNPERWIPPILLVCSGFFVWTAHCHATVERERDRNHR